jgi:16S rRNA (guanine527-N7)-methyltransferase
VSDASPSESAASESAGAADLQDAEQRTPPPAPLGAVQVFGEQLAVAERFTAILTDTGVTHGLIGPREVPKLWERHLLNCAVIHSAFADGQMVIDVGSGAGLPGIALAIARPDLDVHLVEPMLRRTNWLSSTIEELELTNVTVHRGRAEEFWGVLSAPVVTARAVAKLSELAGWCLPLLLPGGSLLALKGSRAAEELETDRALLRRLGAVEERIETFGLGVVDPATTVLRVVLGDRRSRPTGGKKFKGKSTRRS